MDALKVLQLLEKDKVKEAKDYLREVIFLSTKSPTEKSRYSAMKRFIKYATISCNLDYAKYPNFIEPYNIFISPVAIVATKEQIGEITSWNSISHSGQYPFKFINDILREEKIDGRQIDFKKLLIDASIQGYELIKQEFLDYKFIVKVDNYYYKLVNLDYSYAIIADDSKPYIYTLGKNKEMVCLQNEIGCAYILRLNQVYSPFHQGRTIFNIDDYT